MILKIIEMMDENKLIVLAIKECCELIFSSSDESESEDDKFECTIQFLTTKTSIPRANNYFESVVLQYTDGNSSLILGKIYFNVFIKYNNYIYSYIIFFLIISCISYFIIYKVLSILY